MKMIGHRLTVLISCLILSYSITICHSKVDSFASEIRSRTPEKLFKAEEVLVLLKSEEDPNSAANSSEETSDDNGDSFFESPSEGFIHATVAAISVIVVSEIGDKTFFIAVILSMKHSRIVVFTGALIALILMTVLSAVLGHISTVIPRVFVHYISVALFIIFGLKMLKEGYSMASNDRTEYDEVQKTIQDREYKFSTDGGGGISSVESGVKTTRRRCNLAIVLLFAEAFTMTFLAEWGDRSQLTTIILAARENVYGVIFGAVVGHAACTLLAVVGGRMVADRISVRNVTLLGGAVFLLFAIWALILGPGDDDVTGMTLEQFSSKSTGKREWT